jgi:hypothetical protein
MVHSRAPHGPSVPRSLDGETLRWWVDRRQRTGCSSHRALAAASAVILSRAMPSLESALAPVNGSFPKLEPGDPPRGFRIIDDVSAGSLGRNRWRVGLRCIASAND